jgi:biotin carboxyl carrier protein
MIKVNVTVDGKAFEVDLLTLSGAENAVAVTCNGEALDVAVPRVATPDQMEWIIVNGRPYEIAIDPSLRWIKAFDGMHRVEVSDRSASVARPSSGDGRVKAPIPGLVTRVLVAKGDAVEAGQSLLLLEAMKMENDISILRGGAVKEIRVQVGQKVNLGDVLLVIA